MRLGGAGKDDFAPLCATIPAFLILAQWAASRTETAYYPPVSASPVIGKDRRAG